MSVSQSQNAFMGIDFRSLPGKDNANHSTKDD